MQTTPFDRQPERYALLAALRVRNAHTISPIAREMRMGKIRALEARLIHLGHHLVPLPPV
jgi:hypothetical protein